MNDVQFNPEDEQFSSGELHATPKESFLIKLVLKTGLVKNSTQANYVLVVIAIVFFATSIFLFKAELAGPETRQSAPLTQEELEALPPEFRDTFPQ